MTDRIRGIAAVIGSSVAIFWQGAFVFSFPGVMASYWQDLFQVQRGAIGSTLFFVLAAVGIFMYVAGRWQERFGTRRMMTLGALVCGLDMLLIAYASRLFLLYIWAFLMGVGSCLIFIPALTTVQRWFPQRKGLVSGIVNFMHGFSAAVMSPVFGYLLESIGYVATTVTIGVIALVAGTVAAQFTGLPKGEAAQARGPQTGPSGRTTTPMRCLTLRESVRTRSFWLLWTTWALQGAGCIAMVTLSTQFWLSKGFELASAVAILSAFNLTNGISRLLMGYYSDLAGRTIAMSAAFLAAGCAYFLLPHANELIVACVFVAVIGFSFGTLFAVSGPLAADCFGLEHFGAIFGLILTGYGFAAGLLGPALSGYILDVTNGNFVVVFSYFGVFSVISGTIIRFVTPPKPDAEKPA